MQNPQNSFKQHHIYSVIKTLSYSSVFEYPLKFSEIKKYLIAEKRMNNHILQKTLQYLLDSNIIQKSGVYYSLAQKSSHVQARLKREKISQYKIQVAKRIAKLLSFLPTIQMIGLSGSVSMKNAEEDDDIDLFIICSSHTLWMTRIFVFGILLLLHRRRKRNEQHPSNMICANMYVTHDSLALGKNKNIFLAHEIAQVKVLVNKNNTYQKFLFSNKWIQDYLPHLSVSSIREGSMYKEICRAIVLHVLYPVELMSFVLQYLYMKPHKTQEIITQHRAQFHPRDITPFVVNAYEKKYLFCIEKIHNEWFCQEHTKAIRILPQKRAFLASFLIN